MRQEGGAVVLGQRPCLWQGFLVFIRYKLVTPYKYSGRPPQDSVVNTHVGILFIEWGDISVNFKDGYEAP